MRDFSDLDPSGPQILDGCDTWIFLGQQIIIEELLLPVGSTGTVDDLSRFQIGVVVRIMNLVSRFTLDCSVSLWSSLGIIVDHCPEKINIENQELRNDSA